MYILLDQSDLYLIRQLLWNKIWNNYYKNILLSNYIFKLNCTVQKFAYEKYLLSNKIPDIKSLDNYVIFARILNLFTVISVHNIHNNIPSNQYVSIKDHNMQQSWNRKDGEIHIEKAILQEKCWIYTNDLDANIFHVIRLLLKLSYKTIVSLFECLFVLHIKDKF